MKGDISLGLCAERGLLGLRGLRLREPHGEGAACPAEGDGLCADGIINIRPGCLLGEMESRPNSPPAATNDSLRTNGPSTYSPDEVRRGTPTAP
mmetsp:Transcript_25931/g.52868  ORF Transcript_25931/g.52868 Transcript_25931/m.52868 type:complete len:94 (+) Transcript_25931:2215-2496(+)